MSLQRFAQTFVLSLAVPALAHAQAPAAAPAKPDSPQGQALVEKAKKTAGTQWAEEAHFFCEAPRGNNANDPVIAPTKIFDNVYVIDARGASVVSRSPTGASRVDLIVSERGNEVMLEVNTLPGMTPTSLLPRIARGAGLSFEDLVEEMLQGARLRAHGHRRDRRAVQAGPAGPERRVGFLSEAH